MFLLAAVTIAAAPAPVRVAPTVQAIATIRVERGVTLKLNGSPNPGLNPARNSQVKLADGTRQAVKVIDFQ